MKNLPKLEKSYSKNNLTPQSNKIEKYRSTSVDKFFNFKNNRPKRSNSSSSSTIYSSESNLINLNELKTITVKITSNWGDLNEISCSSILLLDENRLPIPIIKIKSTPNFSDLILNNLTNRILIKKDLNEIWSTSWPPENNSFITFIFFFYFDYHPKFLRIWNQKECGLKSVKNVTVINDLKLVYKGEVPKGFGIDIQFIIQDSVEDLNTNLFDEFIQSTQKNLKLKDKYGIYPFYNIEILNFEIISNWGDELYFGIHSIDIFNLENKLISSEEIYQVICENCSPLSNPENLILPPKSAYDDKEILICEGRFDDNNHPTIIVKFKIPIKISHIIIWNFDINNRSFKLGIKNIKIKTNNKILWSGRIPKAFDDISTDQDIRPLQIIWFTDFPEIRDKW